MSRSPFLNDPRDELSKQIAMAVASPIEDVRAVHLRAAEQAAELAKANGLSLQVKRRGKREPVEVVKDAR